MVIEVVEYLRQNGKLDSTYRIQSGEGDILHHWIGELICDKIALRLIGPAFLNAFIMWQITWNSAEHPEYYSATSTHPHPYHRICLMKKCLDNDNLSTPYVDLFHQITQKIDMETINRLDLKQTYKFNCVNCSIECQEDVLPLPIVTKQNIGGDNFMRYFEDILLGIDKVIDERGDDLIPDAQKENISYKDISELAFSLKRGMTIYSIRIEQDNKIDKIASDLQKERDTGDPSEYIIEDLLKALEERPTIVYEILNAGWEVKTSKHLQIFREYHRQYDKQSIAESTDKVLELLL